MHIQGSGMLLVEEDACECLFDLHGHFGSLFSVCPTSLFLLQLALSGRRELTAFFEFLAALFLHALLNLFLAPLLLGLVQFREGILAVTDQFASDIGAQVKLRNVIDQKEGQAVEWQKQVGVVDAILDGEDFVALFS